MFGFQENTKIERKIKIELDSIYYFYLFQFCLFYLINTKLIKKLNNLKYKSFQIIFFIFNYFCVFFVFSNQIQFVSFFF